MRGVLLDKSGRVEPPPPILGPSGLPWFVEENLENGWEQPRHTRIEPDFGRLPQHILDLMEKSKRADFSKSSPLMNASQGWEALEGVIVTDGGPLTGAAEAIMVPDILLSIPRPGQKSPGITFKYTLLGSLSMAVTTPGNFIMRLRWGGLAGALLVTSATVAPTGTQVITNASFTLEYWVTFRTEPTLTTATAWCQGRFECPGTLETTPASTTIIVAYMKATQIPPTGAAVSPSLDVTTAKALSPTYQLSLGTASLSTHIALVESLN
jgi:hypothetical protein